MQPWAAGSFIQHLVSLGPALGKTADPKSSSPTPSVVSGATPVEAVPGLARLPSNASTPPQPEYEPQPDLRAQPEGPRLPMPPNASPRPPAQLALDARGGPSQRSHGLSPRPQSMPPRPSSKASEAALPPPPSLQGSEPLLHPVIRALIRIGAIIPETAAFEAAEPNQGAAKVTEI